MRKFVEKNGGFTLVEILVVIGIIAMLSTLAVNGYLSYRRSALLDLTADNLVSQINQMRSKATYGTNGMEKFEEVKLKLRGDVETNADTDYVEDKPKCYGVVFEKSIAGEIEVKSFSVDFINTKVWKNGTWEYQGCEKPAGEASAKLEIDSQMRILEITDEKGALLNSLLLEFMPPNGGVQVIANGETLKKLEAGAGVKIKVQYGVETDMNYQREINFDLLNMKFSINKIQNAQ